MFTTRCKYFYLQFQRYELAFLLIHYVTFYYKQIHVKNLLKRLKTRFWQQIQNLMVFLQQIKEDDYFPESKNQSRIKDYRETS
jgi:hypothetical protein